MANLGRQGAKDAALETQLYRHFDKAGNLLYVGVSLDALYRLGQHKSNAQWFSSIARVTVERFPTRGAALAAERIAIQTERPHHNKHGARPADVITRAEPPVSAPAGLGRPPINLGELKQVMSPDKISYTIDQLSQAIGIGSHYIKAAIAAGKLRALKMPSNTGKTYRTLIRRVDAEQWKADHAEERPGAASRNPATQAGEASP